jgi:choline dehydrogenase-like flavoprotein
MTIILPPATAYGFADHKTNQTITADVVIVGSGPGGAATAKILSEGGLKVVVVESGPKQSNFRPNYAHIARYHMQESGTMIAKGQAMMPIAAGKGIGGSTLINSALSFRTPDHVLDSWAELLDDASWTSKNLAPIFDSISELIGVGVTREEVAGKNNSLIVDGIKKLGWDGGLAPRSTPNCVGCGICYFGCPSNGKASMNLTLLPRAQEHNTSIYAETEVREILVENSRAVGVKGICVHPETKEEGVTLTFLAKKVILSAGAIGTPKLLWQTGLATEMGPHVGEGLHVHPGSTLIATSPYPIEMWKGATQGAYCHPPDLPGVLPHTFSAPPEACLLAAGFVGKSWQEGLALLPYLCGMLVMVSDKGTGSVRAYKDGRADISYNFHDDDVQRIKQGLVAVAEILLAGGAKDLRAPIHGVGVCQTSKELEEQLSTRSIQDFTLYAAHPMSTCRMGKTIETGVIDNNGQSHAFENLYIFDASIFPTSLGVNPQLSTMVCATHLAQKLIHTW